MVKTYLILQGENSNNADVLEYCDSLTDAKRLLTKQSDKSNKFILMIQGSAFGEGFHRYTLELVNNKWCKNTRI